MEVLVEDRTRPQVTSLTSPQCIIATSNTSWIQHSLGLAAYLQLRGFEVFKEPHVITQYESERFIMISAAIVGRQQHRLASKEWLSVPWLCARTVKRKRQYLLDLASQLPSIYLDFTQYHQGTQLARKATQAYKLETSMEVLLTSLRVWEAEWRLEESPCVNESVLSDYEQRKCGFATKLIFDDDIDDSAFTFIMYNTILIILLELWITLRKADTVDSNTLGDLARAAARQLPGTGTSDIGDFAEVDASRPIPSTTSSLGEQSWRAAMDICRTLPLYQQDPGSWTHGIQLLIAIRMAIVVFRKEDGNPQVAWLIEIIQQISESRRGWEIGKYTMQEFGFY